MRGPTGACCSRKAARSRAIPSKPRWIVDPLDGTTNFLHGIPHFSISIAVEEKTAGRAAGDHPRPRLSAADRRGVLGGKGPRVPGFRTAAFASPRAATSPIASSAPAFPIAAAAFRRTGRRSTARSRPMLPACAASVPPRWTSPGSRRAGWTASGKMSSTAGTRRRAYCSSARQAVSSAIIAGPDRMFERREYIAASGAIHSRLQKLIAGALR